MKFMSKKYQYLFKKLHQKTKCAICCYFIPTHPRRHFAPFAVNSKLVWSWGCAEQSFTFCYQTVFTIQLPPHNVLQKLIWNIYPLFRLWNIKVQQTKNCFSQTFSVQARHGSDVMFSICIIPVGWCISKSTNNIKHHVCLNLGKVFRLRTVVGETNTSKGTF